MCEIRLVIARTLYDWDGAPDCFREEIKDAVRSFRELHNEFKTDPTASTLPAPHSPHGASPEMIQAGAALAKELDIPGTCISPKNPSSWKRSKKNGVQLLWAFSRSLAALMNVYALFTGYTFRRGY